MGREEEEEEGEEGAMSGTWRRVNVFLCVCEFLCVCVCSISVTVSGRVPLSRETEEEREVAYGF